MKSTAIQQRLIKSVIQVTETDAEAARTLGWDAKRFNHYRLGTRCADDDAIVALAEMIGENPEEAVRQHRAEQAKTPQMRQFWLSFGKAAAAIMIIGLSSALLPSDAFASQSPYSTHDLAHTKNYAKSRNRRRKRRYVRKINHLQRRPRACNTGAYRCRSTDRCSLVALAEKVAKQASARPATTYGLVQGRSTKAASQYTKALMIGI